MNAFPSIVPEQEEFVDVASLFHRGMTGADQAALRVRYFTAADLVRNPLPRTGRQPRRSGIDTALRVDLVIHDELQFAPLDATGRRGV